MTNLLYAFRSAVCASRKSTSKKFGICSTKNYDRNYDGVNSIRETEDTPYLNLTIPKDAATQAKLELNKIHFFPADESLGIGLPNFDGTISLLIEGRIHKDHRGE